MKIDFSTAILSVDGTPVKIRDREGKPDYTLRDVAVNALFNEAQGAPRIDAKEKIRRTRLGDRIFGCAEPIHLPVEDVSLLKEMIDRAFGTLTTARAHAILEGQPQIARQEKEDVLPPPDL